jgi:hypothetical protein
MLDIISFLKVIIIICLVVAFHEYKVTYNQKYTSPNDYTKKNLKKKINFKNFKTVTSGQYCNLKVRLFEKKSV